VSAARSPGATEKARAISRRPTLPERLPMNASTSSLEGRGRGLRLRGLAIEVVGRNSGAAAYCASETFKRRNTAFGLLRPTGLGAHGGFRRRGFLRCLAGAFGRLGGDAARRGRARFGKAAPSLSLPRSRRREGRGRFARGGTFRRPAAERLGARVD